MRYRKVCGVLETCHQVGSLGRLKFSARPADKTSVVVLIILFSSEVFLRPTVNLEGGWVDDIYITPYERPPALSEINYRST